MKLEKRIPICLLVLLLSITIATSQPLKQMQSEDISGSTLHDKMGFSLLIVESTIPNLMFESNRGIKSGSVVVEGPGIWHIYLTPGVQLVSISADGYLPLNLGRFNYQPQPARKIRISEKAVLGAFSGLDENRTEIKLIYQPESSDEAVYGGLDDMLMKINFSKGYAVFNPPPGIHRIKLNLEGRVWEKSYDLKPKEKVEEIVSFSARREEDLVVQEPGNLFIMSEPSGAGVYLNKFEQGETPLTLDDVLPGTYQIEVAHNLYLPETKIVEVVSNSYTKENFNLIPNFGRLSINSLPSDAMIWINNQQVGKTPFVAERYSAGTYSIRLIREMYYEETDTITIQPGGKYEGTFELKPQFGRAVIASDPPGARLSMDGQAMGKTPVSINELPSGRHIINITSEHYFDFESTINIVDGQVFDEIFELKPNFGLLTVISNPEGATVSIAETGKELGITPLVDSKISSGTYTILINKELYENWERPISVIIDEQQQLEAELIRKVGRLRIKTDPPIAEVFLNGKSRGHTPNIMIGIPTGNYEIRIEKEGYDTHVSNVEIIHNKEIELSKILGTVGTKRWLRTKREARGWSPIPGVGQYISGQNVRGSLYVCGFAGCLTMMVFSSVQYSSTETDYNDQMTAYRAATDQASMDFHHSKAEQLLIDMKDHNEKVKIFSLLTTGIWLLQFTDAWVFGGGEKPISEELRLNLQIRPFSQVELNTLKVGLNFRANILN